MNENPYQASAVSEVSAPAPPSSEAEVIRQQHLHCEASIKGMGILFFLGGLLAVLAWINVAWATFGSQAAGLPQGPELLVMLACFALIPVQFFSWWGLRRLRPWAKIPAGILSGLGLILGLMEMGLGSIICIYFLFLLFGKKGRMVLSSAYQSLIEQTPGMKYRTPMWNWIVLGIILILAVGGVVFAMNYAP